MKNNQVFFFFTFLSSCLREDICTEFIFRSKMAEHNLDIITTKEE